MKIALIFGKGLDGCGVEKYAAVLKDQLKDQLDIFNLKEKTFVRGGNHVKNVIDFKPEQIKEIAQRLDREYDIVIYNSYPGVSNEPSTVNSFFFDLILNVNKPITVAMMHEIKKANYERIPYHVAIANQCDVVYNFSLSTDYSKQIQEVLTHKIDRIKRFRMPMNIEYNSIPFEEKQKRVVYAGRWTSMKRPRYLLNFLDIPNNDFKATLIGIERSIGAKTDILDHSNCSYKAKLDDISLVDDHTVYGPYDYLTGQELLSKSMFGYSGFTLPKEPHNYGDRMEYSQMEIFINGTIPIFDKHYGENNIDSLGNRYIDNDRIALWTETEDFSDIYDQMVEISNNKSLYEEYVKNGKEFIYREVSSDIVVPEFIEEILESGKESNKFTFDELLLKTHGNSGPEKFNNMKNEINDRALSFNIKDCKNKELSYYIKRKRATF